MTIDYKHLRELASDSLEQGDTGWYTEAELVQAGLNAVDAALIAAVAPKTLAAVLDELRNARTQVGVLTAEQLDLIDENKELRQELRSATGW